MNCLNCQNNKSCGALAYHRFTNRKEYSEFIKEEIDCIDYKEGEKITIKEIYNNNKFSGKLCTESKD